jgi:hypothetical protein
MAAGVRIRRCYDPRRMSSAPARYLPMLELAARGILWTALFAVLAAGAAGLIAQASHPPGSAARADLTAEGDAALDARLDAATATLESISADVDRLADVAKTALEEIASADPARLQASLDEGTRLATAIDTSAAALRTSLADLRGDEADAVLHYGNDTLVRRAAVLTALDAAAGLNAHWEQVAAKAGEAVGLTTLIAEHDRIVVDAAALGRNHHYRQAATALNDAILAVANVKAERNKLIADTGQTVLDEWTERSRDYDLALQALYVALDVSGGNPNTVKVQLARAAERRAYEQLPPDRRAIIVIVAEVARGGLTQAVLAIDDTSGRIDAALAEAAGGPAASAGPEASGQPVGSEPPDATDSPGGSFPPLP